jgi:hypothetical protein
MLSGLLRQLKYKPACCTTAHKKPFLEPMEVTRLKKQDWA